MTESTEMEVGLRADVGNMLTSDLISHNDIISHL